MCVLVSAVCNCGHTPLLSQKLYAGSFVHMALAMASLHRCDESCFLIRLCRWPVCSDPTNHASWYRTSLSVVYHSFAGGQSVVFRRIVLPDTSLSVVWHLPLATVRYVFLCSVRCILTSCGVPSYNITHLVAEVTILFCDHGVHGASLVFFACCRLIDCARSTSSCT